MSRDALIVGINIYRNLPNLQAPAEDAEAIAKLLNQYGEFDVMRRLPEAINQETQKPYVGKKIEVSFTELEDALVKLFKPEGQNIPDTALFYFSGHGIRKTKGIQEGFLATSDVNPSVGFNGLSLQWLRRLLAESPIKQQIIWLDCCHSGELLNFNEANPGDGGKARDRCFIAASREFEPAYEDLGGQYSVLTKVLREGLNPEISPQRLVTNISLTDYLNRHLQGAIQTSLFSNFGEPIKLTRSGEVGPDKPVTDNQICPYKGLQYFDYGNEDYKYFYGREKLTDELLDKIRETNFLAVLGASGSGKSSVIRAGLLHQLKQGRKLSGSSNWQIHILVPGEDPRQSFELSFIDPGLSNLDRALQLGKARELLEKGAEGLELLVQCSDAPRVVIFIDQFEEVFTLCQDLAERKQFFECLLGAVEKARGKLCIIIAMRADFLGKCLEQEYSGLARKIQENLVPVLPLNRKHLQEAIAFPARRVNLMVEEGLIQQMITEVEGAPGSLPLLEYTLTQLWENRTDNQLKLSTYAQLGGIGGTLNKRAREVYGQFSPEEQNIAKYIFLSLTQLGEETEDTRRRISRQDLITEKHPENLIEQVLQKLANERLIVTQEDNLKSTIIDVAHEALIRHWEDLRGWLDESRDALRKQREIERDAKIWQLHANNPDYLWLGFKLAEAEQVLQTYAAKVSLSNLAQEFIEACREQELSSYLRITDVDSLDRKGLEEEAAVKSFLTKDNLRQLLENDKKEEKIRLAASWLLKQWGEEVTMVMAEIDGQGKISLRIIKSPPTLVEELGNGITLELVEIPRGEFWMGSLEGEEGSNSSEYPRHKVRVSPFLMGKYPVTQAQWRAIASLTPVERELILQPSYFKGDNCPVESVSWYDAVEFCKRLSRATGRDYRLPSEAEWEYACRAVTSPLFKRSQGESNPPFHFGETISPDLANYSEADRARTTPVGRFQVANAFGLYDLHGLVWEFCEDNWHDNYEGAPTDGTAWLSEKTERIVLRGGSWDDSPNLCRSHFRNINITRINILNWIGFRVVCMLPKTY